MQDDASTPVVRRPLHDVSSPSVVRNLDDQMSDVLGASPNFAARMAISPGIEGLEPPPNVAQPVQRETAAMPALPTQEAVQLRAMNVQLIDNELHHLRALHEQRLPEAPIPIGDTTPPIQRLLLAAPPGLTPQFPTLDPTFVAPPVAASVQRETAAQPVQQVTAAQTVQRDTAAHAVPAQHPVQRETAASVRGRALGATAQTGIEQGQVSERVRELEHRRTEHGQSSRAPSRVPVHLQTPNQRGPEQFIIRDERGSRSPSVRGARPRPQSSPAANRSREALQFKKWLS